MAFSHIYSCFHLNRHNYRRIVRLTFSSSVKKMGNTAARTNQTQFVEETIKNNCVTVFSKSFCPSCNVAKRNLDKHGITYKVVELDKRKDGNEIMTVLHEMTQKRTVPRVFVDGQCIGGSEDTQHYLKNGKLFEMLNECMKSKI